MSEDYKPMSNRWKRCIIGGERLNDADVVGGKMKRGGTRCAHKACWEKEQAEFAKEAKR